MKTAVYTADMSVFDDRQLYRRVYESMPALRRMHAGRMRFEADRMLCAGAWYLLSVAVRREGYDIYDLGFTAEENRKPYFTARPDIRFSLSHSGRRTMCSVSEYENGCDVEHMRTGVRRIAERFFTGRENAMIDAAETDDEKTSVFYRIWTLKESYIKAEGKGLEIPLDSFSVLPGEDILFMPDNENDAGKYSFFEYERHDGYRYALCIRGGSPVCAPEFTEITADNAEIYIE